MSNFQETVNLKDKPRKRKSTQIEQIFDDENNEMHKIDRPAVRQVNESIFKKVLWIIFILVIIGVVYFVFFSNKGGNETNTDNNGWYAVKLVNNEIYYGQIEDIKADPVIIDNVYYNYDQAKGGAAANTETSNLRLVKRGKETHGPDGTMSIVRMQILYMEPLKADSKVLEAILDYEK